MVPFAGRRRGRHAGTHHGAQADRQHRPAGLVENRPGAGGTLGADAVAKSPPDGYTMLHNVNGIAISPSLYKQAAVRPAQGPGGRDADRRPTQFVLTGSPKLEANSVQEVIALARAKPGKLNYGSSGVGKPLHLQTEMFKHATGGLEIMHIPYRGDAPMLDCAARRRRPDRLHAAEHRAAAGRRPGSSRGSASPAASAGRRLPDVPTMTESGVNGMDDGSWYGLFVPAGTPPQIVQTLQQAMAKTLADRRSASGSARPARNRSAARPRTSRPSSRPRSHALPA